jgi:hypothetical protein
LNVAFVRRKKQVSGKGTHYFENKHAGGADYEDLRRFFRNKLRKSLLCCRGL